MNYCVCAGMLLYGVVLLYDNELWGMEERCHEVVCYSLLKHVKTFNTKTKNKIETKSPLLPFSVVKKRQMRAKFDKLTFIDRYEYLKHYTYDDFEYDTFYCLGGCRKACL